MTKIRITVLSIFLLISSFINAQKEALEDRDYISFVSVFAGLNSTKYQSSDILSNSEFGTGFNVGFNYTLFPDYEWQSYFIRFGIEYSKEQTEDNVPRMYQQEIVTVSGDFNHLNASLFFAYRFNREAKIDTYIGAGGRAQYLLNANESYTFIRENGTTFPVFQPDNPNAPVRYHGNTSSLNLGLIIETGAYFILLDKFAHAGLGFITSKFMGDNGGSFSLRKSTWYFKFGYQIF